MRRSPKENKLPESINFRSTARGMDPEQFGEAVLEISWTHPRTTNLIILID